MMMMMTMDRRKSGPKHGSGTSTDTILQRDKRAATYVFSVGMFLLVLNSVTTFCNRSVYDGILQLGTITIGPT